MGKAMESTIQAAASPADLHQRAAGPADRQQRHGIPDCAPIAAIGKNVLRRCDKPPYNSPAFWGFREMPTIFGAQDPPVRVLDSDRRI